VFSRYSIKYYVEVIRKLTVEQRSVIEKFGFGCLLLLDLHDIPSQFARWVADCVDPVCSQITVCYKHIDISKSTVHLILGLPKDGLEVPCNSDEGKDFILSHFHLSEMPYITFFGNKLCGSEVLSEHDIFVCFMVVAISCFLCPNLREYPNNKYLSVLRFPEAARQYDFSKLVYECCLESISEFSMLGKLKGRRLRAPVCCNYVLVVRLFLYFLFIHTYLEFVLHLYYWLTLIFHYNFINQVHYLDCFDFGRKNVEQTTPRIKVWKGSMIRVFSELDRKRRHCFGKRHLKEVLATCRAQVFFFDFSHILVLFYLYMFCSDDYFFCEVFSGTPYYFLCFSFSFLQGVFSSDVNHRKTQSPIFDPVSFKFRDNVQNRFVSNLRPDVSYLYISFISLLFLYYFSCITVNEIVFIGDY
jgi:hypothetical protein